MYFINLFSEVSCAVISFTLSKVDNFLSLLQYAKKRKVELFSKNWASVTSINYIKKKIEN